MKTPGQPQPGLLPTLYGGAGGGINRRALLTGGLLLPLAARAGAVQPEAKALGWTGKAYVPAGERQLEIAVKTRVEPFVRARSETRLIGTNVTRTMIIEPDGGFVERDGARKPLPERQTAHERAQYGLYGYMLRQQAEGAVHLEQPGLPAIDFSLGEGRQMREARYDVPSYEDESTIRQRVVFDGFIADKGIAWPKTITIWLAEAKTFNFRLDIETFSVELA